MPDEKKTTEEIKKKLEELTEEEIKELSDEELENLSGGAVMTKESLRLWKQKKGYLCNQISKA